MSERGKILIVDDDEVVLATTQALLSAAGYEVSTHAGAFGASSTIGKTRPDLLLLDVNMPGLSGPSLADLVRREPWARKLRIVFFSSGDDDVLQATVDQAGVDGYVRKGDRTELQQKISRSLAGPR